MQRQGQDRTDQVLTGDTKIGSLPPLKVVASGRIINGKIEFDFIDPEMLPTYPAKCTEERKQ